MAWYYLTTAIILTVLLVALLIVRREQTELGYRVESSTRQHDMLFGNVCGLDSTMKRQRIKLEDSEARVDKLTHEAYEQRARTEKLELRLTNLEPPVQKEKKNGCV